ncbi:MAG: hypothetical protein RLY93_10820 [Sumerlaeia bacterium]
MAQIAQIAEGGESPANCVGTAAHESTRATMLYDRTGKKVTLDEIERVRI